MVIHILILNRDKPGLTRPIRVTLGTKLLNIGQGSLANLVVYGEETSFYRDRQIGRGFWDLESKFSNIILDFLQMLKGTLRQWDNFTSKQDRGQRNKLPQEQSCL